MKKLKYSIHSCSSYAPNFAPENILEDKPHDQSSRWSSETNYPPQFLILKLDSPALLETITFGKFDKTHICNLKKLKIFVGMTEACTLEVLEAGLKNDSTPETLDLRVSVDGHRVPCLYVKIAPLVCWGPSFALSIWYVGLTGENDVTVVAPEISWLRKYEETQIVKLCLKHFRQQGYYSAFQSLTEETGVSLEDNAMTELYRLVTSGAYDHVEQFMEKAVADGQCAEYMKKQTYRPVWVPLTDMGSNRPGMRGGHQMCVDPHAGIVYLLGGWDGHQDMGDLWSFNVNTSKWTLISKDTSADGGPCPRSCHKMVLDLERQQLFVLGRYIDTQCRATGPLLSDFYMYDIAAATWTLITEDTAAMGGPQLLFDHQMCFDALKRTIYVFGGRVLTPPFMRDEDGGATNHVSEVRLSGLYSYHVATNTWTLLCDDWASADVPSYQLRSRVGHSMLFHPKYRRLYVFGGQRNKDLMFDMSTYDVDTGECTNLRQSDPQSSCSEDNRDAPPSGYTQRAALDPDLDEIYVLSGLSKDKDKRDDNVQYSLWVYSIASNRWTCIHRIDYVGESYWSKLQRTEPCPRFAHQFIYDPVKKVHYLFGGNPGRSSLPKLRLDDFWVLHLSQPSRLQILKKFRFVIRKHRFEEQAITDRLGALEFLQTSVYDIIDHDDNEQTSEFHALTSLLFQAAETARWVPRPVDTLRDALFNKLLEYFPSRATQPKLNLLDILPNWLGESDK